MTPKSFVSSYYQDALTCEKATGISAIAILAQAALGYVEVSCKWVIHTRKKN